MKFNICESVVSIVLILTKCCVEQQQLICVHTNRMLIKIVLIKEFDMIFRILSNIHHYNKLQYFNKNAIFKKYFLITMYACVVDSK